MTHGVLSSGDMLWLKAEVSDTLGSLLPRLPSASCYFMSLRSCLLPVCRHSTHVQQ